MQERSLATIRNHWGETLGCPPSAILTPGVAVTAWERPAVEFLLWDDGAAVAAPASLTGPLRERVKSIPADPTRKAARDRVTPVAAVADVLGPQYVGYCDASTVRPVETEAQRVNPVRLRSLRDACPEPEWDRSAIHLDTTDRPTFAVVADGQPVAAAQLSIADGVAGIGTITHPSHRGCGHGTAVVARAVDGALDRDLLPEYRTIEHWAASVALAERVGFERVARSILVRLDGRP